MTIHESINSKHDLRYFASKEWQEIYGKNAFKLWQWIIKEHMLARVGIDLHDRDRKAYAIKDPKGNLLFDTFSDSEQNSIFKFGKYYGQKTISWTVYGNMGYRCVPVEITEINKEKV